jgi:hypothetical protein
MFMYGFHNAGRNNNLMIPNKSFENVVQFKCLGSTITNKNCVQVSSEHFDTDLFRIFCLPVSSLKT